MPRPRPLAGGIFRVDAALNAVVYGRQASVEDILSCRVEPPTEFQPLFALLEGYARDALHSRSTAALLALTAAGARHSPGMRSPGVSPPLGLRSRGSAQALGGSPIAGAAGASPASGVSPAGSAASPPVAAGEVSGSNDVEAAAAARQPDGALS